MIFTAAGVIEGHSIVDYQAPLSVDIPIRKSGSAIDNVKEGLGVRGCTQQTAIDVAREKGLALFEQRVLAGGGNGVVDLHQQVVTNGRNSRILLMTGTPVSLLEDAGRPNEVLEVLRQIHGALAALSRPVDPLPAAPPTSDAASTVPVIVPGLAATRENTGAGMAEPDQCAMAQLEAAPAFTEDDLGSAAPDAGSPAVTASTDTDSDTHVSPAAIAGALAGVGNGYRR